MYYLFDTGFRRGLEKLMEVYNTSMENITPRQSIADDEGSIESLSPPRQSEFHGQTRQRLPGSSTAKKKKFAQTVVYGVVRLRPQN